MAARSKAVRFMGTLVSSALSRWRRMASSSISRASRVAFLRVLEGPAFLSDEHEVVPVGEIRASGRSDWPEATRRRSYPSSLAPASTPGTVHRRSQRFRSSTVPWRVGAIRRCGALAPATRGRPGHRVPLESWARARALHAPGSPSLRRARGGNGNGGHQLQPSGRGQIDAEDLTHGQHGQAVIRALAVAWRRKMDGRLELDAWSMVVLDPLV